MKAKIKLIMEQFGEFNLETYNPENENSFCLNILLGIGIDDDTEAMDYFDLKICTLSWLHYFEKKPKILRHIMIVDKYDFKKIKSYINECINECQGESWNDIANKLSRYFFWEYEDY